MRSYEFYIKPAAGECADASVPLPQSDYAVLSGRVTEGKDSPVEAALVLLLEQDTGRLLAHTITDAAGRFWFGPLSGDQLYTLRVQKSDAHTRILELHM